MKPINQLCDIVRQTAYNIHRYHVFTQGRANEEGLSKVSALILCVSAFFAFLRG
jgi:hypothetical protein